MFLIKHFVLDSYIRNRTTETGRLFEFVCIRNVSSKFKKLDTVLSFENMIISIAGYKKSSELRDKCFIFQKQYTKKNAYIWN